MRLPPGSSRGSGAGAARARPIEVLTGGGTSEGEAIEELLRYATIGSGVVTLGLGLLRARSRRPEAVGVAEPR
jgi:hypothetical protein